jgi:membrane protease YdiL (CAAX protease family)
MLKKTQELLKKPYISAPLLVLFVIFAMQTSKRSLVNLNSETNVFVAIGVIQLVVLALPSIVYYLLKGRKLDSPIYLVSKSGPNVTFLLFSALFFVCGTLLIKFFYFVNGGAVAAVTNYYSEFSGNASEFSHLEIILSLIIIPAICEEFLFRGIIFGEYRKLGTANAIIISAVCFAMLHFSLQNFFVYLFSGLLFGFCTAMTKSIIPSIALHLLSNTLSIYASDAFLRITVVKNGAYFIGFVLVVLTGVSLLLLLSRVENMCYSYAEKPRENEIPPKSYGNITKVFLSPTFLLLLIAFVCLTSLT